MKAPDQYTRMKWTGLWLFLAGVPVLMWSFQVALSVVLLLGGAVVFAAGSLLDYLWQVRTGNPRTEATPFVKIFVLAHMFIITVKCLPTAPDTTKRLNGVPPKRAPFGTEYLLFLNDKLKPYLDIYTYPTGVWQSWDMFSPNPSDWEGYVTAKIFYKDGTEKIYQYPRMYIMPLGIKYFKERYRKFLERAHADAYDFLRPRFALRAAVKNYTDPNNPPVKVELWRHYFEVPGTITLPQYLSGLVSGKMALFPKNPDMPPYKDVMYYPYIVEQDKLKEMAGF